MNDNELNIDSFLSELNIEYPDMYAAEKQQISGNDAYRAMHAFTEKVEDAIVHAEYEKAANMINRAQGWWKRGCYVVHNAVVNTFLYHLDTMLHYRPDAYKKLMPLLNEDFKKEMHLMHVSGLP